MMGFSFLTIEFVHDLLVSMFYFCGFIVAFCYGCTMAAINLAFETKAERAWKKHKKELKRDFIKKYN